MTLPPSQDLSAFNVPDHYRTLYRAEFFTDLAAGHVRPFVLPWSLVGTTFLPLAYHCIPHVKRPWLFRARFLVAAVVVWLHASMIATTRSQNFHISYGTGLIASWGTTWALRNLIWTRPQFDMARVHRRTKGPQRHRGRDVDGGGVSQGTDRHVNAATTGLEKGENGHAKERLRNAHAAFPTNEPVGVTWAPDESVAACLDEYEYYWQDYPSDAPFMERLDWALDLVTSFRAIGWSHPSCKPVPDFRPPSDPHAQPPVDLASIPLRTRAGFSRSPTYRSFLLHRLTALAISYLVLDLFSVIGLQDPYWIVGPELASSHPLPSYLSALSPTTLSLLHSTISLAAIMSALSGVFSIYALLHCLVPPLFSRRPGGSWMFQLWKYPTLQGSFLGSICSQGLAGFWGCFWHQTFRTGFTAPADWLIQSGYMARHSPAARAARLVSAFVQSSLLHAAGSVTAVPRGTRPWEPALFFQMATAGILVQSLATVLSGRTVSSKKRVPAWMRGAGNLVFTAAWLHWTRWALTDDLGRAGMWLSEPVPFSLVRLVGLGGYEGEKWWRWGANMAPEWYIARRWWESGLSL